ncbi:hypothetical protein, partial [uncultured Nostoc sp.]|uniref:hypothetical protein n=1 Tax=uncultured Nostoc sp. TaxID=340711 RepID=UPI0035CC80D7
LVMLLLLLLPLLLSTVNSLVSLNRKALSLSGGRFLFICIRNWIAKFHQLATAHSDRAESPLQLQTILLAFSCSHHLCKSDLILQSLKEAMPAAGGLRSSQFTSPT